MTELADLLMGFNCTFMELKFKYFIACEYGHTSFNCTFMELKFRNVSNELRQCVCFNCTFMELKYVPQGYANQGGRF